MLNFTALLQLYKISSVICVIKLLIVSFLVTISLLPAELCKWAMHDMPYDDGLFLLNFALSCMMDLHRRNSVT